MGATIRKAVMIMNLGSPDTTSVKDVRRYLNEFLMDENVIDIPAFIRGILVKGIIVPFRAPKSAEAYRTIWTKEGSPLIVFTKQLQKALQELIEEPVVISMRYGSFSPKEAFAELKSAHPDLEEVILLPLYPHFAMSSYETAADYAKEHHAAGNYSFSLKVIKPFYNDAAYIHALSENIKVHLGKPYDHLLFSYHGIPERHIRKSDTTGCHCLQVADCCNVPSVAHDTCYRHQVFATTQLVTAQLGIPKEKYSISFQSRLGSGWLQPFTDKRLEEMPKEGIKNLLVVCPAFVSDCLETLEEIAERGKETFMEAGGDTYEMIPCLNTHSLWVETIAGWIRAYNEGNKEMILH